MRRVYRAQAIGWRLFCRRRFYNIRHQRAAVLRRARRILAAPLAGIRRAVLAALLRLAAVITVLGLMGLLLRLPFRLCFLRRDKDAGMMFGGLQKSLGHHPIAR